MRVAIELLHIAAGIAAALLVASLAAWAYPLAVRDIWIVAIVAIVVTLAMSIGQVRRALAADRAQRTHRDG